MLASRSSSSTGYTRSPCLPGLAGHGAPPPAPLQLARGSTWGRTGLPLPLSCPCTGASPRSCLGMVSVSASGWMTGPGVARSATPCRRYFLMLPNHTPPSPRWCSAVSVGLLRPGCPPWVSGSSPLSSPRVEALRLSELPDSRVLTMCAKRTGELAVGVLYKLMQFGGVDVPFADFVWGGFAPSKAKFFAWLLVQSRIQSRAALFKKHVLSEEEALCPICESERETVMHLIFACPFVRRFWDAIGWSFPVDADVRRLFSYDTPAPRGSKATSTLTILLCWNIWKHRNGVAFRGERASLPRLLSMCREEAALWELRAPAALHDEAVAWPLIRLRRIDNFLCSMPHY
ncbi:hypothetical protein QYE76_055610 [Lolium multiflorum]|uniref:Reverse transcriptase zinc-binding domain-containing protein n=1 Tax=Lolium multiflorum TaxID=4521 RepID=A0AAD8WMG3_LOLMU|nr:hypothetical protein QYE76_055610 [Lolium multiflorum]